MDETPSRARRIVGLALLGGAALLVVVAALFYTGVIPVAGEMRGVAAGAVGAAALVDGLVGLRFLLSASQT